MFKKIVVTLFMVGLIGCKEKASLPPPDTTLQAPQAPKVSPVSQQDAPHPVITTAQNPSAAQASVTPSATVAADNLAPTELTAIAQGVYTSALVFQTAGYLKEVYVKNGDVVKKGQLLAKLDDSMQTEQVNASQLSLQLAQNTLKFAKLTYDRTKGLINRGATTTVAWEQAESSYNSALIGVSQASSNLKVAKLNLQYTRLEAPYSGVIFNLNSWIGDYVSVSTPIFTLTSSDNLQFLMSVPQTMANNFKVGQKLSFRSTSQSSITGMFFVTGVVPYIDATSKTYTIVGAPQNVSGGKLMSGEVVVVKLQN